MILYRCFAWNQRAKTDEPDGVLWFPRVFQGEGRHDNPDLYGCLYLTKERTSAVVEQLARFRGRPLIPEMLLRRSLPLAVATIELAEEVEIRDLDEPRVLARESLRPSLVATRARAVTQPWAHALYRRRSRVAGIAWWSTFESLWANVTVFDRARRYLEPLEIRELNVTDEAVLEAASFLGI